MTDAANKLDSAINEPNNNPEDTAVRAYRHWLYPKWLDVVAEIESLRAENARLSAQIPVWVPVSSYKDVPEGTWLALLEKPMINSCVHSITVHPNITFIASVCVWDAPRVIAYCAQPESLPPAAATSDAGERG